MTSSSDDPAALAVPVISNEKAVPRRIAQRVFRKVRHLFRIILLSLSFGVNLWYDEQRIVCKITTIVDRLINKCQTDSHRSKEGFP